MTAPPARSLGDRGDLAAHLLRHADWMVSSGQFRGTVRQYLGFLHPYLARDEALRLLDERERSETATAAARDGEETGDGDAAV